LNEDGTVVAFGCPLDSAIAWFVDGPKDELATADVGSAFVMNRDENGDWSEAAYLKSTNSEDNDKFGELLAMDRKGRHVVVTAVGEDSSTAFGTTEAFLTNADATDSGAVYTFQRSELRQRFYPQATIQNPVHTLGSEFGSSVAFNYNGDVVSLVLPRDLAAPVARSSKSSTTFARQ